MPYLKMFRGEDLIDEVFISDHLLQTVLGWSILEEEKQRMTEKHADALKRTSVAASFSIDAVASSTSFFSPVNEKSL
jgi:hypothetical protein